MKLGTNFYKYSRIQPEKMRQDQGPVDTDSSVFTMKLPRF